ncbi:UDP-D-xylose:L-fucose alpha-1,3-D-xylosyltransferase [Holothuria leucospilota]|uniref:UDP-D-xylose:L-fucose alpha-1,3-D-xylosyltransferase n=1 Tax=Holothuria leucospilota TaxID=206669 RepID=A0A9Q1CP38_HOLLE|nr:UDP-D-xylose:L-fucose alpha-1,3-D-xylosyltransferase [Holothuria leucospilota]
MTNTRTLIRLIKYLGLLQVFLLSVIVILTYFTRTSPIPHNSGLGRSRIRWKKPTLAVSDILKRHQDNAFPKNCNDGHCSLPTEKLQLKKKRRPLKAMSKAELRQTLDDNVAGVLSFPPLSKTSQEKSPFVILTATNSNFSSIMDNWLESIRRLRVRYNVTLMSEDDETFSYFSKRSNSEFKVLSTSALTLPGRLHFRIPTYQQLIRKRTVYIFALLSSGRDVLLADIDAVWKKDPMHLIFDEYEKHDMWIAQGKEDHFPCPCFFYMKSIPRVIDLVVEWVQLVAFSNKTLTDQNALALLLESPSLNVDVKYLSYEQFPLGSQYFNQSWHEKYANGVYVVHGNHLGRGSGKIEMFKNHNLWYLDRNS